MLTGLTLYACTSDSAWSGNPGTANYTQFEGEVYPLLMRDCGFANCHGVGQRAFQVWGPGRSRLRDGSDDIIAAEKLRTYARALSMLYTDGSRPLMESPLLTKPLEINAVGATHAGADRYGRNVYRTQADPGFQVLLRWAQGMPIDANPAIPAAGSGAAAEAVGGAGAAKSSPAQQPTAAGTLAQGAEVAAGSGNMAGTP